MSNSPSGTSPESTCKHKTYYDEIGETCRYCDMRIPWCFPTKPTASDEVAMTDTPEFDTFEEMYKYLQEQKKGKTKTSAKHTATVKTEPVNAPPASEVGKIYKVIHYYLREGDTYRQILIDAREDRSMVGENILIKVHCHGFTDDPKTRPKCGPKCVKV